MIDDLDIESCIIQSLMYNKDYFTKTYPYLESEHFDSIENKELFNKLNNYYKSYQTHPTPKELGLSLKDIKQEKLRQNVVEHFKRLVKTDKVLNLTYLIDETEKYIQKQKFKAALIKGAEAIQSDGDLNPIYGMMEEALKVSFDSDLGLDYENIDRRLEYYKKSIQGFSTGVKELDDILGGGFQNKTLNIAASQVHGGKCLHRDTFINIFVDDKQYLKMMEFLNEYRAKKYIKETN